MAVKCRFGDCLQRMQELPTKYIDLVIADLPYGNTNCKWDSQIELAAFWRQLDRIVKASAPILIFGMEPFSSCVRHSRPEYFRYDWIYEKTMATGFLNSKKRPLSAHEIVSVFYRQQCRYFPQMEKGKAKKHARKGVSSNFGASDCYGKQTESTYSSSTRYPRSVIKFSTDKQKSALHPTQKPVALMEYLIKTYTEEGDTILDPCMGSGTTGVACIRTGRNFIGIEKDRKYFDIAKTRLLEAKE